LNQLEFTESGELDENEIKVALKLCSGHEPSKRDVANVLEQINMVSWQNHDKHASNLRLEFENILLARYAPSPTKRDTIQPWESLIQVRHAELVKKPSVIFDTSSTTGRKTSNTLGRTELVKASSVIFDANDVAGRIDSVKLGNFDLIKEGSRMSDTNNLYLKIASETSENEPKGPIDVRVEQSETNTSQGVFSSLNIDKQFSATEKQRDSLNSDVSNMVFRFCIAIFSLSVIKVSF